MISPLNGSLKFKLFTFTKKHRVKHHYSNYSALRHHVKAPSPVCQYDTEDL